MAIPIVQAADMRLVGATERVRYALPGEQVDGGAAHPVVIVTDADIAAGRASMPAAAISESVRFVTDRRVNVGNAQPIYIQNDPPLLRPEDVSGVGGVWYGDRQTYSDTALLTPAGPGQSIGGWASVAGSLPAFVQATADRRPLRHGAAIVFDGVDDLMAYTGNTLMNAASRTVMAVVSAAPAAATRPLFSANAAANWYVGQTGGSVPNGRMISNWQDAGAVARNLASGNAAFDGLPHVYTWRHTTNGANVVVEHWRDADGIATTTRTDGMNATTHSTWNIGAFAAGSLNGAWTVSALAIFPFALSEAQRLGILAYWQIIYGLV